MKRLLEDFEKKYAKEIFSEFFLQYVKQEKKNVQGSWVSYCPFSSSGRDTVGFYRVRQGWVRARGARYGRAGALGCAAENYDTARNTASSAAIRPGLRIGASGSARTRPGHLGVSRYNFLYRGEGRLFMSRHDAVAPACVWRHGLATQR